MVWQSVYKPGSVLAVLSLISNCSHLQPLSTYPLQPFDATGFRAPCGIAIYMVFQLGTDTATAIACNAGGLLPHLLTLTLRRLFSSAPLCPREHLPIQKSNALCCPDFPHQFALARQDDQLPPQK